MSISILLIVETRERHTEIDLSDMDAAAIHIESSIVPHLAREFATILVHRSVVLPVPDQGAARVLLQMEVPSEARVASSWQSLAGSTVTDHIKRCAGPIVRQLLGRTTHFEVLAGPDIVVLNPDTTTAGIHQGRLTRPDR